MFSQARSRTEALLQQLRVAGILLAILAGLLCCFAGSGEAFAQCTLNSSGPDREPSEVQALVAQHDWAGVVRIAGPLASRSADLNFDYGIALAHLQQWPEARGALMAGARQCPGQKRFAIELAGVAFEQKRYPAAAAWLRKGLKLDPMDTYANNFAGTNYYLMGNLDAALKYWNRVQRPSIAALRFDPLLHVQRLVLDRAFAFSPQAVLKQPEYETTEARLKSLGIFPSFNIVLGARPDGSFDADFHALERNGFGSSRVQALVSTFSGAVYETVYPSYFNLRGTDTNFQSLLRWDKEKRRAWVSVSAPVHARPEWRWRLSTDERDENWVIRRSFTGVAPPLGSLNLERQVAAGSVTGIPSGRLQWSTAVELSHRTFRDVSYGTALTPELVTPGFQVKYLAGIDYKLLNIPERRFSLTMSASSETGRLWSSPPRLFEKLQGSALAQWFPQAQGDTYEVQQRLRAGRTFGNAPFDELFLVGMERDSDLWARGQIGTRDGRKGSSPLGYNYFLANSDFYRRVYGNGLFTIKAGPLFDIAKVGAPASGLTTNQWIFDTGVEAKLTVFGTSVVLTYGRDLRAAGNAFYGTVAQ
jgi:tetratricopeptide (TPR) repeat protein